MNQRVKGGSDIIIDPLQTLRIPCYGALVDYFGASGNKMRKISRMFKGRLGMMIWKSLAQ